MLTNLFSQYIIRELNDRLKDEEFQRKFPHLNFSAIEFVDEPIMMLTTTNRTEASAYERILKQPVFDAASVAHKNILINDDHVNAGAFTATLFAAARELGANIVGVSALTVHPHTTDLKPDPQILQYLKKYANEGDPVPDGYNRLNRTLAKMGLTMETLTNREALTLLAILMDGNNAEHKTMFERLDSATRRGIDVVEGKGDSLMDVLMEPKMTVSELVDKIEEDISTNRFRNPERK